MFRNLVKVLAASVTGTAVAVTWLILLAILEGVAVTVATVVGVALAISSVLVPVVCFALVTGAVVSGFALAVSLAYRVVALDRKDVSPTGGLFPAPSTFHGAQRSPSAGSPSLPAPAPKSPHFT